MLLLSLLLALACACPEARKDALSAQRMALLTKSHPAHAEEPEPPSWPAQFHAHIFSNRTGRLSMLDLWYDWPQGRNLNLITSQLGVRGVMHDVEYDNHTSFYYDLGQKTCKVIHFDVGILRPDWLTGAKYNGMEVVNNITTYSYTQADGFITYWCEVVPPHRPVRWRFYDGVINQIMSWHEGETLEEAGWQAPPYCFTSSGTAANVVHDEDLHVDDQEQLAVSWYWKQLKRRLEGRTDPQSTH